MKVQIPSKRELADDLAELLEDLSESHVDYEQVETYRYGGTVLVEGSPVDPMDVLDDPSSARVLAEITIKSVDFGTTGPSINIRVEREIRGEHGDFNTRSLRTLSTESTFGEENLLDSLLVVDRRPSD